MPFNLGPVELGLILLIVAMLFGVGKLPEVFGSIGKGVREFRKESGIDESKNKEPQVLPPPPPAPVAQLPQASTAQQPYVQQPYVQAPPVQAEVVQQQAAPSVVDNTPRPTE